MIRMGAFSCSVARLGQVKIKYLVDYLDAEKPEMSTDQVLVLNIVARKDAEYRFRDLKDKVQRLKDQNTELYKSEKRNIPSLLINI
jgi:hypothetical protein